MTSPLATDGLPVGEEKTRQVRAMFDTIAPHYELVNRLMTFGLDARWRRRTVQALGLPPASVVLDVASGTGDLCAECARQGLRAVAADLSMGMLRAARRPAPRLQSDAAALPIESGSMDGVLCGYALRNFTDLSASLGEMSRVLRPGGRLALLEVCEPQGVATKAGFHLWFDRAVPLIGGLLSDRSAYEYLPRSVAYLPAPEELRAAIMDAGFSGVNRHVLTGGLSQLYTATRAGAVT